MKTIIFILLPVFIFGSTYYLDNYAPESGNGSINLPFNSLNRSLNELQPGDTLILRGSNSEYGQIYIDDFDLPISVNKIKNITIMNYQDEVVVISVLNEFKIDEHFWTFSGIIFEDHDKDFQIANFSGKNNTFYNCVFRNSAVNFFDGSNKKNNIFKFCKIEK